MAAYIQDEEISDEFSFFGVELSNEDILDKVKELCLSLSKDASKIVEEWVAFAQSCGVPTYDVNLENLTRFEREMEKKKGVDSTQKTPSAPRTPKFRSVKTVGESDDLLNSYASPVGNSKSLKRQLTPDNTSVKRRNYTESLLTPHSQISETFSPVSAKPSEFYKTRLGSGDIIRCLNAATVSWKGTQSGKLDINLHPDTLVNNYKYMFQKNMDKINVLDEIIEDTADEMKKKLKIDYCEDFDFAHANLPAQEEVTIIGRIACDRNGKLNAKSVILEGSRENASGRTVALDLSGIDIYTMFPGQILALQGVNTSGNQFVVKSILDKPLTQFDNLGPIEGPFSVLVACGPFTTSDSLAYEPLEDLLEVLKEQTPDVCILMGPFIDENNVALGTLTDMTFDELFQHSIASLLESTNMLANMTYIFVPSSRDVHHAFVYPQPPYLCPNIQDPRAIFVADPTVIRINNVTFGLTSTDSLFHLSQQELSNGPADRIPRLVRHLLQQQKFYPLYPPGEDVNLDLEHYITHAQLPVTPHVLLLPSRLGQFVKDVSGCCCINPGTLSRGKGGSYAQIVIRPAESGRTLGDKISVQVLKI